MVSCADTRSDSVIRCAITCRSRGILTVLPGTGAPFAGVGAAGGRLPPRDARNLAAGAFRLRRAAVLLSAFVGGPLLGRGQDVLLADAAADARAGHRRQVDVVLRCELAHQRGH